MAFRHEPVGFPQTVEDLARYVENQFLRLSQALEFAEAVQLVEQNAEPIRPRDGLIALADGVNWDPGNGSGYYGYHNGSWTFLG